MTDHRPLSVWTATVGHPGAGAPLRPEAVVVNDGDERADARRLPKFARGWQRVAVTVGPDRHALGLVHPVSGETVVELSELSTPVVISEPALRVVARIERQWPDAALSEAELRVLRGESVEVRRVLLARLADEGEPSAELFHLLPWELVGQLAEDVTAALDAGVTDPERPVIRLRHWFRPVGSRFTAALEQLDEGVRDDDRGLIRVAATSLCARLGELDAARLPMATRRVLAALTDALARDNRFLGHPATLAAARLIGDERAGRPGAHMATHLVDAAEGSAGIRRETTEFERPPFTLRLTVSATGRVMLGARAPLRSEEDTRVGREYGVLLLPVRITDDAGGARYWLVLRETAGVLVGTLNLPVPAGASIEADTDGPPIGLAEAGTLPPDELERSVLAVTSNSSLEQWETVARSLPPGHPSRAAIERAAE